MSLQNLKRWHWILISLILGVVLGNIRHYAMNPDLDTRGSMTQREFEMALARNKAAKDSGRTAAIFSDLVVTRIENPRDRKKTAYKVDVQYFSGSRWDTTRTDDGKAQITTRPKMFIAPVPYHPGGSKAPVQAGFKPSSLQKAAEALRLKKKEEPSTVLDYLAQSAEASGVKFSYKWHHERRVQMAGWTAASFVLVGLIWPTLVNLMYFGSLTRPKEEKAPSLRHVSGTSAPKAVKPTVSQTEMDKLAALEAELTAKLGGFGANTVSTSRPAEQDEEYVPPPVIKALSAGPVEPVAAVNENREDHEFKKKEDDFYPTERRVKPPKE